MKKTRVLTAVLKNLNVFISRRAGGYAFQRVVAADWNARSPSVERYLVLGGTSNVDSFDLRVPRLPFNGDRLISK